MKVKKIVTLIILTLLIGGCSSIDTISSSEANEINISKYFPPVGLQRTYIQYGIEGENANASNEVKSEYDSSGNELFYVYENGEIFGESFTQYTVSTEELKMVYKINDLNNNEVNEVVLANKTEWKTGDGDNSISYLTGNDLTIEVPAGIFDNSIEVTEISNIESDEVTVVNYYAPTVGLIKTVFILPEGNHVFTELESSNVSILGQKNATNKEETSPSNKSEELNPAPSLKTPDSVGGTSELLLSDYIERVNEKTFQQLEYYIFNNPEFNELDTGDYIYNFSVLQGELSILTNQEGLIRNLSWNGEVPMTDETLLNIQSIILGLNPTITIEEVNDFLFNGKEEIAFEHFIVNLFSSPNSFQFEIYIK